MHLSDLKKAMKGIIIIQITPFNEDGSLDLEGMRANTRWLLERSEGKDCMFTPMGGDGEFYTMSDDERKAVIKLVVEEVKGKKVVCPEAAQIGTRETIKMVQYAESVGADAVMILSPYYSPPTEEGVYQHYKQIAESVSKDFGIMLYNNPGSTGSWMKPPLLARLSKIPNIIADKENTPSAVSFHEVQRAIDPNDMVVMCGRGEHGSSFTALFGFPGFASSIVNFAPGLLYALYEAAAGRDFDKMVEVLDTMAPYFSFSNKATANHGPHVGIGQMGGNMLIGVAKAAMDIVGLRGGEVRLPNVGLTEREKTELRDVLRTMKLVK